MGIMHPWHKQFLRQIHTLMESTNDTSMTGDLIQASAEQLRLEMGTGGDFFETDWQIIGTYVTSCWLKSLFQYMQQHDMRFKDPVQKLKL